ncbi:pre-mRNA-splicing factor ISY1 homolog isoform X2 [Dreissena polymorpha]|nr:pre-mRNA-splicing factor ISY1 homolog isoform X2 [Dreissena polymorpha]
MTALARWRAAHIDEKKEVERRPYLATECDDLKKAEKFRRQIIGEVSKKVAQIQNAGLGEFKLRDINDEINKLLREKGHWEDRIKELDGPDYRKIGPKMLDHEGKEVPGNRGYKYFGAAKDLPGVRELFEQEPPPPPRKTRGELMKDIDADYYGYRDEDDGVICPLEQEAEKKAIADKVTEWKEKMAKGELPSTSEDKASEIPSIYPREDEDDEEDMEVDQSRLAPEETELQHFIAHVEVPSQKQIEEALLQRKKQELLQKYVSDDQQQEEGKVKQLLGL